MENVIYLDNAASTPIDPRVKKAIINAQDEYWANASSSYALGRKSAQKLEVSRHDIAKILGAKPSEITFTSGSTEAANMAIFGITRQYPNARVVATAIEHEAVHACLRELEKEGRFTGEIPVSSSGVIDPESVISAIDDMTVLVCVMYVNNEIGTIQPITKIAKKISDIRADRARRGITMPLYFYCDAAQAGLLSLAVSRLNIDLLSMGGTKLYGPRGSGFLYIKTGLNLEPVVYGGGQESGLRSGTQNLPAALGLALSLQIMQNNRSLEDNRQAALRDELWQRLQKDVTGIKINGERSKSIGSFLNICVPGVSGEDLVAYMDNEGVEVATGAACSAASVNPSHVLSAIGLASSQIQSSVRISLGRYTTKSDIIKCATALKKSIKKLAAHKK